MASEVHHAKAQQLLQQIDLAKGQRRANDVTRQDMLDAEDRVLHLYRQLYVQRMHTDANEALEDARSKLTNFEQALSYSESTKRLEASRFIKDCGLEATQDMLTNEDAVCSLRAVDAAMKHMKAILGNYPDGDPHLRRYIVGAMEVLSRAGRLVQQARIESDGWLPVLGPVMQALEQLVKCRPIEEPLGELVYEIDRLSTEDHRLLQALREAAELGETARGEDLTRDRIMVLEGVADLVTHKFRVISTIDDGTLSVLRRETARIRTVTIDNAKRLLTETEGKRTVLSTDLDKITEQMRRAQSDQELARGAFLEAKAASDHALSRNADQQKDCWRQMLALEQQLKNLAEERRDEVDRRARMVEREERRRCDMNTFAAFAEEHETVLRQSLDSCEAEEELGQMMQEIVLQACQAVDAKVHAMQRSLENTRVAAYQEHSERFREQYLHLGDVMYRKERLVDELDRRIDMLNLQQDLAMETFNPKAKLLSEQRAELEVERQQVHSFLEELQEKASAYVESFKPTEKALRAISNTFVHPIFELQRNNKARSRKLDQFYAATVHDAEMSEAASRNRVNPRLVMLPSEIEAERQAISAKRTESPHRAFVGRDGERPSVDRGKASDFNPLGFPDEAAVGSASSAAAAGTGGAAGGRKGRRTPATIKTRLQRALSDAAVVDDASQSGQPDPRRVCDRLVRSGFGLAEDLEPAAGRALAALRTAPPPADPEPASSSSGKPDASSSDDAPQATRAAVQDGDAGNASAPPSEADAASAPAQPRPDESLDEAEARTRTVD